jgi:hypothetical protein
MMVDLFLVVVLLFCASWPPCCGPRQNWNSKATGSRSSTQRLSYALPASTLGGHGTKVLIAHGVASALGSFTHSSRQGGRPRAHTGLTGGSRALLLLLPDLLSLFASTPLSASLLSVGCLMTCSPVLLWQCCGAALLCCLEI